MKKNLKIHSFLQRTEVEGPYKRFAIWVQGCSIRCSGCFNRQMWNKKDGSIISVDQLFEKIQKIEDIEGISLLGGEPFDQSMPLSILTKKVQEIGLGVVTFTGYTYDDLISSDNDSHVELLNNTDLLIDGPYYEQFQTFDFPWVGSSNQRYIHISERYLNFDFENTRNGIEIELSYEKEKLIINGMIDGIFKDKLLKIFRACRRIQLAWGQPFADVSHKLV